MNSGLLLMAVMGLLFPAVLHFTHTELHFGKSELVLSRFSSCIMLVAYGAYIFFQLTSEKSLYTPIGEVSSCHSIYLFSISPYIKCCLSLILCMKLAVKVRNVPIIYVVLVSALIDGK